MGGAPKSQNGPLELKLSTSHVRGSHLPQMEKLTRNHGWRPPGVGGAHKSQNGSFELKLGTSRVRGPHLSKIEKFNPELWVATP